MYTIGEVEKITGISKDRLRYYEEKGILNPLKVEQNAYRMYRTEDVIEIISIEQYRAMDLGVKAMKQMREIGDVPTFQSILSNKAEEVEGKIEELQRIYTYVKQGINDCKRIQKYLNEFSIKPMPAFKVVGQLSDSTAFSEYGEIQEKKDKDLPIIRSIMRQLVFRENQLISNKMLVIEEEEGKVDQENEYMFTIVEEKVGGADIMGTIFEKSMAWLKEVHYTWQGIVYVKVLFLAYPEGKPTSYLEIYGPVKKNL